MAETQKIQVSPEYLRLRERVTNRATKIYREKSLKEQGVIEKRMITVEILAEREQISAKEHQLYFRVWDQQTWELSDRFELQISKSDSPYDLATRINSIFPHLKVNFEKRKIEKKK